MVALDKYIEATNSHDFSNVKVLLEPNAVYWFSDRTCTTLSEIQAYFERSWEIVKDEVYSATDIRWIAVDNNSATCIYTYNWAGYINDKFTSGKGRATNVFVKNSDGIWQLVHEHLSSN